ncbi:MAG: hypothetical protein ABW168_10065, partial [Sedimenticola sp.]
MMGPLGFREIALELSAAEAATMNGGMELAWRSAGSNGTFTTETLNGTNGSFNTTLTGFGVEPGAIEFKLSYTDNQGREVIVQWGSTDVADGNINGHSLAVVARETEGAITLAADGGLSIDPGLYVGSVALGGTADTLTLQLNATDEPSCRAQNYHHTFSHPTHHTIELQITCFPTLWS